MSNAVKTIVTGNHDTKGNAQLFVEYLPVDLSSEKIYDSSGNYSFETSLWLHSDFYVKHGSNTYSLSSKLYIAAPDAPRYAEVIDGKAYIMGGVYKYPYSEEFEDSLEIIRRNFNEDAKETYAWWSIAEIEQKERGEIVEFLKSPSGDIWWSYNELQNSEFVNKIVNGSGSSDQVQLVNTSTWSGDITIKSNLTASATGGNLTVPQIDNVYKGWQGSILNGSSVSDQIFCKAGWDLVNGSSGDDFIRAGNGRDIITGGAGADELWGDFGWNTYTSSKDGGADLIIVKSDQFLYNWIYEKAENNSDGRKCDIIEGLDTIDRIRILGVSTQDLTFRIDVTAKGVTGIGIYGGGFLEVLYTGGDLTLSQIASMTSGDASPAAMANEILSYGWTQNQSIF